MHPIETHKEMAKGRSVDATKTTNVWGFVRRLADIERGLDDEVSGYLSLHRQLEWDEKTTMYMHLLFILFAFTQYSRDERWANMVIGDSSLVSVDDELRTRMYIDDAKWCCELAYRDKYGGKRLAAREYNGLWKRVIDRSLVLVPRSYLFASFNDPACPWNLIILEGCLKPILSQRDQLKLICSWKPISSSTSLSKNPTTFWIAQSVRWIWGTPLPLLCKYTKRSCDSRFLVN